MRERPADALRVAEVLDAQMEADAVGRRLRQARVLDPRLAPDAVARPVGAACKDDRCQHHQREEEAHNSGPAINWSCCQFTSHAEKIQTYRPVMPDKLEKLGGR